MSDTPVCSIIVTTYNQATTIAQTLNSILTQKCNFSFEIIIGDDCSTDNTQNICTDYKARFPKIINLVVHNENIGVGANFALCIKEAHGKYVGICAADDFWHNPNKLQLQVDYMEAHPEHGLLYTDYNKLNIKNGKIIYDFIKKSKLNPYEGSGLIKRFFHGQVPALTLTVMFRKSLFEKFVPAEDYIKYRFPIEDWNTWLILSKYSEIGYLPISTATYRYGHESLSNILNYERVECKNNKEKFMYQYICSMFPDDLTYDETEYLIYTKGILLNLAYKKSDYNCAKKYAQQIKKLGSNPIKVKMASTWCTFKLFVLAKRIRYIVKSNV